MKYLFLLNRKSRGRKINSMRGIIDNAFKNCNDEAVIKNTYSIEEATDILTNVTCDEFQTVVACGGDGTVNFTLNHLIGKNINMGIVPIGTVNTLTKSLNFPKDYKKVVENIRDKKYASLGPWKNK